MNIFRKATADLTTNRGAKVAAGSTTLRSGTTRPALIAPYRGVIRILPKLSTVPIWPVSISVVESISVMIAGP